MVAAASDLRQVESLATRAGVSGLDGLSRMSVSDWIGAPGLPTSAAASSASSIAGRELLRLAVRLRALALLGRCFVLARSLESLPTTYFATG